MNGGHTAMWLTQMYPLVRVVLMWRSPECVAPLQSPTEDDGGHLCYGTVLGLDERYDLILGRHGLSATSHGSIGGQRP
ncbi:unnamed protein product [Phytophthora fragariaefolia]|uniref:Unnamed protein product n=1 Tax=Phytophthora fragariaefolia TaxID=1490495 RepID=A0A9W7CUD6_9STRA|nr:unnamed protein product [Phytophthora fragariaefolia]